MALNISTTGSWPPTYNPDKSIRNLPGEEQDQIVHNSIERAIQDQLDLKVDIFVDGQSRDDIVSIFASNLPGYKPNSLPYQVVGKILPTNTSITAKDYVFAKNLLGERPLKAHITGPMTLARNSIVDADSPYESRNDPALVLDLARALGQEARWLVDAGAQIVQIDEPALADGVDLDLAFKALKEIVQIGEIPIPAMHICKNVTQILERTLTSAPVTIISLEGGWLKYDELNHIDRNYLSRCGKKIGLGCIKIRDYSIDRLTEVQRFLDLMTFKLGEENIWAATPNCGLRYVPHDIVIKKLKILRKATRSI